MSWYKRVLVKNKKEIISSAAFAVVFALAVLLWHFGLGKNFQWDTISPISTPTLLSRMLYSALVFVTFGAFLYWVKFYQLLYHLTVRTLGDKQLYKGIKGLVWGSLMLFMYFWVVPKVVDLLNAFISLLYNILALILYLFPPLGASLIIFIAGYMLYKRGAAT